MSQIYTQVRKLAEQFIEPYADELDQKKEFPVQAFKELGKAGWFSLLIPKEYGGMGLTLKEHAEVCMALAESSASAGLCYMMSNVAVNCLNLFGSDQLKQKIFSDIVQNQTFVALAYSELGTGTHFYITDATAQFNAEHAVFNGLKSMVTSGNYASYYLALLPSENGETIDNWVLPLGTQGLTFEADSWNGLGMRSNVSCFMRMTDMPLDRSWRIGEVGTGAEQVFGGIAPAFICGLAAVYSGVCKAVLTEAIKHSTYRKYTSGTALAEIETVQIHLAKIYANTNAAVCATRDAARAATEGDADALAKLLAARILASENAIALAQIGMRIGGGKAYNKMGPMERYLRDALASQVMAPSVDVLNIWLGKAITGQQIP